MGGRDSWGICAGIPGRVAGAEAGAGQGVPGCFAQGVPRQITWSQSSIGLECSRVFGTCVTLVRHLELKLVLTRGVLCALYSICIGGMGGAGVG